MLCSHNTSCSCARTEPWDWRGREACGCGREAGHRRTEMCHQGGAAGPAWTNGPSAARVKCGPSHPCFLKPWPPDSSLRPREGVGVCHRYNFLQIRAPPGISVKLWLLSAQMSRLKGTQVPGIQGQNPGTAAILRGGRVTDRDPRSTPSR